MGTERNQGSKGTEFHDLGQILTRGEVGLGSGVFSDTHHVAVCVVPVAAHFKSYPTLGLNADLIHQRAHMIEF